VLGPILYHAALGIVLAALLWTVGTGVLRLAGAALTEATLPHAYALGVAIVVVASTLFLLTPWLGVVALALLLLPVVRAGRDESTRAALRPALARGAATLPGAAAAGIVLGLLLHGPSGDRSSHAFGDLTFYVANQISAGQSLLPFRDLLVDGAYGTVAESGTSFVGAALSELVTLDPFLFQTTTLPVQLFVSLAVGFAVLRRRGAVGAWLLAVLLATATIYPTWVAESPPVAMALPLVFSLFALCRHALPPLGLAAIVAVLALDFAVTKGLALPVLAVVAAFAVARHHRARLTPRRLVAAIAAVALVATLGIAALVPSAGWIAALIELKFLPLTAYRGLRAQLDVRSVQQLAPACEVAGELLLAAALWRERLLDALAVTLTAIATTWFLGGHPLDITLGLAIAFAVLALVRDPEALRRRRLLLGGAAATFSAMAWFRDVYGTRPALVLLVFFVVAARGALGGVTARSVAVAGICAASVTALAAARGLTDQTPVLTRDDYAVWRAVRERIPAAGLVFTSLTGPRITAAEGWNYYPGVGERQVFVAGWADGQVRGDEARLERLLAENADVLSGRIDPSRLPLSRRYDSFFAVLRRGDRAPPTFGRVYANERYALYRIASGSRN